jgi:DNA repair protein RadC
MFRAALVTQSCRIGHSCSPPSQTDCSPAAVATADELVTRRLREALQLVDIRVLDHMIVADNGCLSFAERGLL